MRIKRQAFLAGSLLAATSAAACRQKSTGGAQELYSVLGPQDYDFDEMMAKLQIRQPHKQVFSATNLVARRNATYAELYTHMQFAMNGYDFSLRRGRGTLATLGVVAGLAVVLSLNDAMWQKYAIGKHFDLAQTNVYYQAKSSLDPKASYDDPNGLYQDWSAQAVLKRGGWFMACHNALANVASQCAINAGTGSRLVLDDMIRNLQPGFTLVPAGVTAIQLAQEYGWKLYTIT
jgi:hypothetical protein